MLINKKEVPVPIGKSWFVRYFAELDEIGASFLAPLACPIFARETGMANELEHKYDANVWKKVQKNGKTVIQNRMIDYKFKGKYPYRDVINKMWMDWEYGGYGMGRLSCSPGNLLACPILNPRSLCCPEWEAKRWVRSVRYCVSKRGDTRACDIAGRMWPTGNIYEPDSNVLRDSYTTGDSVRNSWKKWAGEAYDYLSAKGLLSTMGGGLSRSALIELIRDKQIGDLFPEIKRMSAPEWTIEAGDPEFGWMLPEGVAEYTFDVDPSNLFGGKDPGGSGDVKPAGGKGEDDDFDPSDDPDDDEDRTDPVVPTTQLELIEAPAVVVTYLAKYELPPLLQQTTVFKQVESRLEAATAGPQRKE